MNNFKRFTLVELVIVLGIMSLIILYATPRYNGAKETVAIRNEVYELQDTIEKAQTMAYEENKQYIVYLYKNGYKITDVNERYNSGFKAFHNKIMYIEKSYPDNKIVFLKDGSPESDGSILLINKFTNKAIEISIKPVTGRVEVKWIGN